MRRLLQIVALASTLAAGTVAAQALDATKVKAVDRAADSFVALAKDSHKTGQPPRQTDTAAKPLLDLVFGTAELSRERVPWSQLGALNGWNMSVLKIGMVYILAGTGSADLKGLANVPDATEKTNRNAMLFAPEMGRYFDAQLWIQGALADTVQEHLRTAPPKQLETPKFKEGLGEFRGGFAQTIYGVLDTLSMDGHADDWRRQRLAVINAIAPKTVKFLEPAHKTELVEFARKLAGQMKDANVKAALTAFAKTLDAP